MKQPILDLDVKVNQLCENGKDNCVWGFINKGNDKFRYGDILKASSWRKPALNHARGNIIDADYEIRGMRLYGPDYLR